MLSPIRLELASPPDRKRLVLQVMIGDEQWAEINQDGKRLVLEIYPRQDGGPWVMDFDEAVNTLADAKNKLLNG
jgi:hypothetical protein